MNSTNSTLKKSLPMSPSLWMETAVGQKSDSFPVSWVTDPARNPSEPRLKPALNVYVFSTENWKRPATEVSFLMGFLKQLVLQELPELKSQGVKIQFLGELSALADDLQNNIRIAQDETAHNTILTLNMMVNYGSRNEILYACKAMVRDAKNGTLDEASVTESVFSSYLYTKTIPDPDILIRTGGDIRISNYLLWQIAYSEFFFLDSLWPDFNRETLIKVLQEFQNRERRFGALIEEPEA